MKHYEGKRAWVFGASEGIGASVCKELLSNGAQVVAFSRSPEKLRNLELQLNDSNLKVCPLDITEYERVEEVIGRLGQELGTPDFVFNFAGLALPGFIENQTIEQIRKMMDLNFFGTAHVVKAITPLFLKAKKGHLVNCSSIAGFLGLFGYSGYCASQFAVIGFSEALRREWEPLGISVSVLCPPNTKTPGLIEENRFKPAEILAVEERATVVEPDFVAKQLLKKLPSKKFLIVPTFDGNIANLLNRISPRIIDVLVRRKSPVA